MIEMPVIDLSKCDACGLCISACACKAILMINGVVTVIETEACGWCLNCETICPTGAITCSYEIVIED